LGCVTSLNAEALGSLAIEGNVSPQLPLDLAADRLSRSAGQDKL
jgi:hypothetical protein